MIEFLKQWGTLIVAVAALLQPWCLALYRTVFRRGRVDIFHTGNIEIGYSAFGATIGLNGTLRAIYRDQFIRSMELSVTRVKDNARWAFDWGVFRTQKLSSKGGEEGSFELPYGFMVSTAQPHRYNVQFFDVTLRAEIMQHVARLTTAWWTEVRKLPGEQMTQQQTLADLWTQFTKTTLVTDVYTSIDRLCYWEPGPYALELRVNTDGPARTFARRWSFDLSKEGADNLRVNSVVIMLNSCGRPFGQFNFAWASYVQAA